MTLKKSRFWSLKEVNELVQIVESASSRKEGLQAAADKFGVTPNAIQIRYGRFKNGVSVEHLKKGKKSRKKPTAGETRVSYKKRNIKHKMIGEDHSFTIDIKDVQIDLKRRKITIVY